MIKSILVEIYDLIQSFKRLDIDYKFNGGGAMKIDLPEILFLQEKPVKILLLLKEEKEPIYVSMIAKGIDGTYAHTLRVLSHLEKCGMVSFEKKGRIKQVKISEFGIKAAEALTNFIDIVKMSSIDAKTEDLRRKKIEGRGADEIDKALVSKRLASYKREVERLSEKNPALKQYAEPLLDKIEKILETVS